MLNTSGIQVTENEDGSVELFYADYGVSEFGGHDYECEFTLDAENGEKFRLALAEKYSGTLEEMVIKAFTSNFSESKFREFCQDNGIEYSRSSWF